MSTHHASTKGKSCLTNRRASGGGCMDEKEQWMVLQQGHHPLLLAPCSQTCERKEFKMDKKVVHCPPCYQPWPSSCAEVPISPLVR